MGALIVVIVVPLLFALIAAYVVVKLALGMLRLFFLPVALLARRR